MSLLKTMGIAGSVAGILLLSSAVALAEEWSVNPIREWRSGDRAVSATTTGNVRVETAKERLQVSSEGAKTRIETAREEMKARLETRREEAKARIETAREEAKQRVETAREEAKTRIETAREEAKQRLSDIRDRAKQQRAERLTEQFDRLNKKWTDHFIQLLDRYGDIVLKIQERADKAATNGGNITTVNASIQSAQTAIENARDAVVAQATASYTLDTSALATEATMTTEGQEELLRGLRMAFQGLHKDLFNDLFALRDGAMRDTRGAVQAALQALSQIPRVDDDDDDDDDASASDSNR